MERTLIRVDGPDRDKFLGGLLTRDPPPEGLGYAALLTPQGKYLADFLTFRRDGATWLDVHPDLADDAVRRLSMYRLRAKVGVEAAAATVRRGTGDAPPGALADPRPGMGWRLYGAEGGEGADDRTDWDALRVANLVPETGVELVPNESYVLEMGFERLGGVDFRKGCYVGQEVTARMKHKTELRKGLARLRLDGPGEAGAPVTAEGREVGRLTTVAGDRALAYLRFDRAGGALRAGDAALNLEARAV